MRLPEGFHPLDVHPLASRAAFSPAPSGTAMFLKFDGVFFGLFGAVFGDFASVLCDSEHNCCFVLFNFVPVTILLLNCNNRRGQVFIGIPKRNTRNLEK